MRKESMVIFGPTATDCIGGMLCFLHENSAVVIAATIIKAMNLIFVVFIF